ncbi:unnamed protein product, partial [Laminaria digitata]
MDVDSVGDDFGGGGSDGDGDSDGEDSDDDDSDSDDSDGGDSDDDDSDSDDSDGGDSDDDDDSDSDDSDGGDSWLDAAKSVAKSVARVSARMYAKIPTTPHSETSDAFVKDSRRTSKQKSDAREGTAPHAGRALGGIGSVPLIEKLVGAGLRDTCPGDLEINNEVTFNRIALSALKPYYDVAYAFNPADIGVVVGGTKVTWDGVDQTVKIFDHGKYFLDDGKSEITQWELLENRCGEGVTLDEDLRRFIRHLVLTDCVMMSQVVPCFTASKNVTTGITWNANHALERANTNGNIDPKSKMTTTELLLKKKNVDNLRKISLNVFTNCTVADILP